MSIIRNLLFVVVAMSFVIGGVAQAANNYSKSMNQKFYRDVNHQHSKHWSHKHAKHQRAISQRNAAQQQNLN